MHLKQGLAASRQAHDRLSKLVWCAGWLIPLAILALAFSSLFWRGVAIEASRTMAQQIDYEDSVLCTKFGFAAGTEKYASCMFDLLDLRHSHEHLIAVTTMP